MRIVRTTTPGIDRKQNGKEAKSHGQLPTEEGDSCEDLGLTHLDTDLDEGDPAVDTCAVSLEESGLSDNTTDESDSSTDSGAQKRKRPKKVVLKKVSATCDKVPEVPATGVSAFASTVPAKVGKKDKPANHGKGGPTIFENGYFFLKSNELDLKMFIIDKCMVEPPVGIGEFYKKIKTITPSTVGEERADPVRTMLLLKAWMLWRARQMRGWIESDDARQRLFTEEAGLVLAELKRLQPQSDGLLGHFEASNMLRRWVPDIVAKVKP